MFGRPQPDPPRAPGYKTPLLLAGGGFAAAFGAASCCGLPVVLASLGLGSGWLATVAWLAAPHRIALLIAALVLLAGGAAAFLWSRHAAFCMTGRSRGGAAVGVLLIGTLLVGGTLVVLGYLYA
jgi:mercuric ion transport protein